MSTGDSNAILHTSGAVADDPEKIAAIPTIISSDFTDALSSVASANPSTDKGRRNTDLIPPTVSISSPANGATVAGVVNIAVNASDNKGVTSVSLTIDGVITGTVSSAPYSFSWNVDASANGNHTVTAKAQDAAGNSSMSTIIVAKNSTITILPSSTLPANYSLVMPPVGFQGSEGACAVFATTYAARSYEEFYKTNATAYSYSTNIFSPEFVYDQTKVLDCGTGTGITTALDFLMTKGVCTWQSMPFSYTDGCSLVPTSSQFAEALNYTISSYSKIVSSDVTTIKSMLVDHHVVIVTVNPDDSFNAADATFIWRSYSSTPGLSHNIVICGYDDAKHAYKVMNSWGTSWGDAGFSWVDYDFFPQTSFYYSYVINH